MTGRRIPRRAGRLPVALALVCALALGLALPFLSSSSWTAAIVLAAVPLAAAVVLGASLYPLLVGLVISSQLSAMRFELAGLHFLPEHVALVAFGASLALRSPSLVLRRPAPYEAILLAWVVWNGVTSLAFSGRVGESMAIVGWLLLAWAILWCVRGYVEQNRAEAYRALDVGMRVAGVLGAAAGVLWLGARAGVTSFGVQPEYVTGTVAARGLSFEANLFGSLELFWLILALRWRTVNAVPVSRLRMLGLVVGVVSSMTRAVWLAAILALLVAWVAMRAQARRRPRTAGGGGAPTPLRAVACLVGLVVLLPLSGPATEKFKAALDFRSNTGLERVRNWDVALDDLGSSGSFLLGRGTNSYGQRHASHTVAGEPGYLGNLGLTVLYDTGVVGVVLFAAASVAFVLHRHAGWGRVFKALFLAVLMIVGAAASPIWFGYVWITVAALGTVWRHEDLAGAVPRQAAPALAPAGPIRQ